MKFQPEPCFGVENKRIAVAPHPDNPSPFVRCGRNDYPAKVDLLVRGIVFIEFPEEGAEIRAFVDIHLGDVYYEGSSSEETKNFVSLWPKDRGRLPVIR